MSIQRESLYKFLAIFSGTAINIDRQKRRRKRPLPIIYAGESSAVIQYQSIVHAFLVHKQNDRY